MTTPAKIEITRAIHRARQSVLRLSLQPNSAEAVAETTMRAEELAIMASQAGLALQARCGVRMAHLVRTAVSTHHGVRSEHLASLHALLREALTHQVGV